MDVPSAAEASEEGPGHRGRGELRARGGGGREGCRQLIHPSKGVAFAPQPAGLDSHVPGRTEGRNDQSLGVTGCSRLGKGAFTIGAFDEPWTRRADCLSWTTGVSVSWDRSRSMRPPRLVEKCTTLD
ncbi:glucuronyl esterase domain-containing protein [Sorangium sp. So ce1099]|uniref:glucuronyl esterase domain-containing protein n=1 Tax=Sorangium sp. So ce1099 TaxID=3133331 RepID=UPI003F5FBC51